MLAHDGPALLDVVTAKHQLSMPPTIGAEQIKGFGLWALRAVMSRRGDEVVDLAKTQSATPTHERALTFRRKAGRFRD